MAAPLTLTLPAAHAASSDVTTVVGGGAGYGGPATSVFLTPWGFERLAVNRADGSLLIADSDSRVLKIPAAGGAATVLAGTPTAGFAGDGGPATSAQLESPVSVASDAAGEVFIAEPHHVRRVATNGSMSTIAGDGTPASSSSGVSATSTGVAPTVIDAFGDGRVVIGEHAQVRVVSPGGVISQLAPADSFGQVCALATAPDGAVFVGDGQRHVVYRVPPAGGAPTIVAGGGGIVGNDVPATDLGLEIPCGLAVGSDGQVYVTDMSDARVYRFAVGGKATVVVDSRFTTNLCQVDIAMGSSGTGAIACRPKTSDGVMQVFHFDGTSIGSLWAGAGQEVTGSPDGVAATEARLDDVRGLAPDASGRVWFSGGGLVRFVDAQGAIRTASTPATGPHTPEHLASAGNDSVYVADPGTNQVWKVSTNGSSVVVAGNGSTTYGGDGPSASAVGLNAPRAVAVDAGGTLYVGDSGAGAVRAIAPGGAIRTLLSGTTSVRDVAVAPDGTLGVATDANMLQIAPSGAVTQLTTSLSRSSISSDLHGGWYIGRGELLAADGSIRPFVGLDAYGSTQPAQASTRADGSRLFADGARISVAAHPVVAAPAEPPANFTATPGEGRITLDWAPSIETVQVVMLRGNTPAANAYSGHGVPFASGHLVLRDENGSPFPAGVNYTFAAFQYHDVSIGPNALAGSWSRAATVTVAALPDTSPPPPVPNFTSTPRADRIELGWTVPTTDDLDPDHGIAVRMATGTTAPTTPTSGSEVSLGPGKDRAVAIGLSPDTDYSFSVFTVDINGNYGEPRKVTARLDTTPPAAVTGLAATVSYQQVSLLWTNPTDADFQRSIASIGAGSTTPAPPAPGCQEYPHPLDQEAGTARSGLTAGSPYTVAVYACDINGNTSAPTVVHVDVRRPVIAITGHPPTMTYGQAGTITAQALLSGVAAPGLPLTLWSRPQGGPASTWRLAGTRTTATSGARSASFTVAPLAATDYQVRYAGQALGPVASDGAPFIVNIATKVTAALNASRVRAGTVVAFSGAVSPRHPGQIVLVQRYYGRAWHPFGSIRLTSASAFKFLFRAKRGVYTLRAVKGPDGDHGTGTSPTRTLTAR